MDQKFSIHRDIRKAATLPSSFYKDPGIFEQVKEKVFYRSWQWIGDETLLESGSSACPFVLLEDFLDEPMVLTRDSKGELHCLSNVCTHRGYLVVTEAGKVSKLRCSYHGRRFRTDGSFEYMPEFGQTQDFPRPCDDLHRFSLHRWGPLLFAGLDPAFDFGKVLQAMEERVGFLPLDQLREDTTRGKDYTINAHWALYCDNYLEGFHIPFVHEGLNTVIDYGDYETICYEHVNVQIGYAKGDSAFDLPEGHVDHGKQVAAYYFWVFPNMMFNFYPWGLSVNLVQPLGMDRTRVSFRSYVLDPSRLDQGAGADLDKVEMEDEEVVEGVHRGIRSRFYKAGRFSPTREQGVHHFHSLLADFLNREG